MSMSSVKTTTTNGVERLDYDGIANVFATPAPPSARYAGQCGERPMDYTVQLVGEARRRRVYAQPVGNVSVLYIKTQGRIVHVESAMDAAFHRVGA